MNDYYALRLDVEPCSADATDLLAYLLGEAGYESFVPDERGLTAYVRAELFSDDAVRAALEDFSFPAVVTASSELVEGRDWNAEWELFQAHRGGRPLRGAQLVPHRCALRTIRHRD